MRGECGVELVGGGEPGEEGKRGREEMCVTTDSREASRESGREG